MQGLVKLNEKNPNLNLGGKKAAEFLELTEQTFLAMVNLNGLNEELQHAHNILRVREDGELAQYLKEDVTSYKIFN